MGKSVSFDLYLIEKLSKYPEQAVDYLKLAIEEGDLELIQMSVENLIKAGYESFTIYPNDSINQTNFKLKQQKLKAKI